MKRLVDTNVVLDVPLDRTHVHGGPPTSRTPYAMAALIAVCAACTPYGYTKPDMTEQGSATDQVECAEIAREQAFLDNNRDRLRAQAADTGRYRRASGEFHATFPSFTELQRRYRRICMLARGYELAPLEEGG